MPIPTCLTPLLPYTLLYTHNHFRHFLHTTSLLCISCNPRIIFSSLSQLSQPPSPPPPHTFRPSFFPRVVVVDVVGGCRCFRDVGVDRRVERKKAVFFCEACLSSYKNLSCVRSVCFVSFLTVAVVQLNTCLLLYLIWCDRLGRLRFNFCLSDCMR